jgi:hypothetical protein
VVEIVTTTGCSESNNVTVTILPLPAAATGSDREICASTSTQIGAAPVAGNSYLWSSSPAGFSSSVANPTVTPASTTTYILTETSPNGCSNTKSVLVTVTAPPVLTTTNTAAVCSGHNLAIGLTATLPSTFTWTIGTITGSITGASAGTGATIGQALTNPSNAVAGTVEYLVTPTSTAKSCSGAAYPITVTVNPIPVVTTAPTLTIASGTGTAIALTASLPSNFTWVVGTVTGGITGAANGTGLTIDQVLTNPSSTAAGTVEYLVIPTGITGTCAGTAYAITVTVSANTSGINDIGLTHDYNLTNFPNPFAYETTISFNLPQPGEVILKIFDVTGMEVAKIDEKYYNQGKNTFLWKTYSITKGLYFLKLYYNGDQAVKTISIIH